MSDCFIKGLIVYKQWFPVLQFTSTFNSFFQSRQTQQTTEFSSSNHRRGHFPHWLFPHDHQTKHSRSPPPSTTPPPPPPRSTALRSKPLTRSVEVQTEPPTSQLCCCSNTNFCPRVYERENVTRCWCTASQGQPIMLHHYHVHHYYHCEEQLPQQQTPVEVESTSSTVPAEPPGTGFRTSSPLIKLSATWPPNMAIAATEESETTAMMMAIETQSPQQEDCCELSPSTEEAPNPPAHVSNALRAVESPQEQIIPPKEDPQEDQRRVFLQNIAQLKRTGWYWGPLTIEEAELLLKDRPNGSFLVRDSGHELYILSLSFRAENRIYHTRIEHTGGKFGFAIQGGADTTSSSIAQFINHVIAESERGRARFFLRQSALTMSPTADQNGEERVTNQLEGESHHVEARLLYPVSRFLVVHSLAHLCRFEILLKVRKDHIDQLPLPDPLKKYLHERQYYTEFVRAYLESLGGAGVSEQSASESTITSDS
uniref:Suppressor of cytokine signaling 7 n=2 Tax=Hymenolepis diminuta TaxID=6216 RepID=A0A0R3SDK4_HYMDI